jgi:serine/threonine-protein kinase
VQAQAVLVLRDGSARLNDLSMAAPLGGPMHPLLHDNTFALSPEYLRGKEYQALSDQFSLGALLYELLTGIRPFRGLEDLAILTAIRDKDPLPPRTIDSKVDPFLAEVAMRALSKDTSDRFISCGDLAQALGM